MYYIHYSQIGNYYLPILKSRQKIGDLFDFVAEIAWKIKSPFRVKYSLVNIYCPDTHYSYGKAFPPPARIQDPFSKFTLTFSRTPLIPHDPEIMPFYSRIYTDTYAWGPLFLDRNHFITINVNRLKFKQFNLDPLFLNNSMYLYNTLGALFSNIYYHSFGFSSNHRYYLENYSKFEIKNRKNLLFNTPMKYLVNNYPRYLWVYNQFVWKSPSLLSNWMITDSVAVYWLLYIRPNLINLHKYPLSELVFAPENSIFTTVKKGLLNISESKNIILEQTEPEWADLAIAALFADKNIQYSTSRLTRYFFNLKNRMFPKIIDYLRDNDVDTLARNLILNPNFLKD